MLASELLNILGAGVDSFPDQTTLWFLVHNVLTIF